MDQRKHIEVCFTPKEYENFKGEYIFFTHNLNTDGDEPVGSFSMVLASTGAWIFSEIAGDSSRDPDTADLRLDTLRLPYSALGVAHDPIRGKYPGGEGNEYVKRNLSE